MDILESCKPRQVAELQELAVTVSRQVRAAALEVSKSPGGARANVVLNRFADVLTDFAVLDDEEGGAVMRGCLGVVMLVGAAYTLAGKV